MTFIKYNWKQTIFYLYLVNFPDVENFKHVLRKWDTVVPRRCSWSWILCNCMRCTRLYFENCCSNYWIKGRLSLKQAQKNRVYRKMRIGKRKILFWMKNNSWGHTDKINVVDTTTQCSRLRDQQHSEFKNIRLNIYYNFPSAKFRINGQINYFLLL